LLQGNVLPPWDETKMGMSSKLLFRAIARTTGEPQAKLEQLWRKLGDLGLVAEELTKNKKQKTLFSHKLTVQKVVDNLKKLPTIEGEGAVDKKIAFISELLSSATPKEAKYIARTVLEELRTGVGEGTLRDALVWAYLPKVTGIFFRCEKCGEFMPNIEKCLNCGQEIKIAFDEEIIKDFKKFRVLHLKIFDEQKDFSNYDLIVCDDEKEARKLYNFFIESVQHSYDMSTDFGVVAKALKEKGFDGLKNLSLTPGKPIKVMLYQKATGIDDAFETVGKPAIVEPKIDGFRMQIHCAKDRIILFTRRLENVTNQFPDVAKLVKNNVRANNFIIDCEIVGYNQKTKKMLPFQNISQRIKRKYDIEKIAKELPVIIKLFDAMQINGVNLLNHPFEERRKRLEAVTKQEKNKIELVEQLKTSDEKKVEEYYNKCLEEGNEGVMMKNIAGIYKPGRRVGYGVKIKPVMETLDLAIVGAEWGEGKRAKWLSSFTLACKKGDQLLEIGKVGTGIKEKEGEGVTFEGLTKELKGAIISQKGKEVVLKPKLVVEVNYEEIQKSPTYNSGYALRFPRIVRARVEKGVDDVNTLKDVEKLFHQQKKQ
ncbi:ATP-dependent DNA ligase, partial [Candidatus Woesearchaeota archaeon]|nr:ATP-dependent DNA ligase [Candidatus Woesearchaeota archaeon]